MTTPIYDIKQITLLTPGTHIEVETSGHAIAKPIKTVVETVVVIERDAEWIDCEEGFSPAYTKVLINNIHSIDFDHKGNIDAHLVIL